MSRTTPENETLTGADAAFRSRVQRFAKVEIVTGTDAIPPRPELIPRVSDEARFAARVERFVHRRETSV